MSGERLNRSRPAGGSLVVSGVLALGVASLPSPGVAQAQETADPEPRMALTVNPIDLVNGYINFELDAALVPFLSFHSGVTFVVWDGVWDDDVNGDIFAVGPEMGLRLYPFAGAPGGLWVGPYAGLAYVRVESQSGVERSAGFYGGGMVGATLIIADLLVGSLGVGLGYHDLSAVIEGERVGLRGLSPRFRLAVGVAF